LGAVLGTAAGLSIGGVTVMATMAASASYIAAPAAVRVGMPDADAGFALGAALGITFPFNLVIGIPLYAELASRLSSS
ncbi:MAG: sodium-dependent bicarbonate transport family permease, partial [Actinomycetota bacterium]